MGRRRYLRRFQPTVEVRFYFFCSIFKRLGPISCNNDEIFRAELEAKGHKLVPVVDAKPEPKE